MNIEEALKKAVQAKVSLTFREDGSGRAYKLPSPNVDLFTWRGLPSFPSEFAEWERNQAWTLAKGEFPVGMRVQIKPGTSVHDGEIAKVVRHDNSDHTFLLELDKDKRSHWVKFTQVVVPVYVYKVKDDVLITSEEGQKGLVVNLDNGSILVYDYEADGTYWYNASQLSPA